METKKYRVTLQRTEYYEAEVEVEATSEEEAKELADETYVENWGEPVDTDTFVCEGDDAVIEVEDEQ